MAPKPLFPMIPSTLLGLGLAAGALALLATDARNEVDPWLELESSAAARALGYPARKSALESSNPSQRDAGDLLSEIDLRSIVLSEPTPFPRHDLSVAAPDALAPRELSFEGPSLQAGSGAGGAFETDGGSGGFGAGGSPVPAAGNGAAAAEVSDAGRSAGMSRALAFASGSAIAAAAAPGFAGAQPSAAAPVPEPSAALVFGLGLLLVRSVVPRRKA